MTRPRVPDDKRQRTAQACDSCKRRKQKVSYGLVSFPYPLARPVLLRPEVPTVTLNWLHLPLHNAPFPPRLSASTCPGYETVVSVYTTAIQLSWSLLLADQCPVSVSVTGPDLRLRPCEGRSLMRTHLPPSPEAQGAVYPTSLLPSTGFLSVK